MNVLDADSQPGQSSLPQSCPVCEHSPLAADDCNPNKSLRTTIRVFLRTAEKKREAGRPKESKDTTPATPVEAPKPVSEFTAEEPPARQGHNGTTHAEGAAPHHAEQSAQDVAEDAGQVRATQPDESHPSSLTSGKGDVPPNTEGPQQGEHDGPSENAAEEGIEAQDADEAQNPEEKTEGTLDDGNYQNTEEANAMDGSYPNMMFPGGGGDFNQMQMMMAMQNGMVNNAFGGFPMMGTTPPPSATQYHAAANACTGMGMDPMTMQNMYMNGGFQGMGMSMGGYGGGFGQGSNNNWNGSQLWSFDQNNYNQSGPGMGTGDFGNFNKGFQTGYNQGNYGQYNDYRRNNFGRGRGRGRGFYGQYSRGGYQHQHGGITNNQDQGHHHQHGSGNYAQGQIASGAGGDSGDDKQVDEYGRSIPGQSGDGEGQGQGQGQESEEGGSADAAHKDSSELASRETLGNEAAGDVSRVMGDASHEPGAIRSVLSSTPDVPINAPTGPKAMRQGLPNTSLHHLRARGYQVDGAAASTTNPLGAQQQASPGEGSRPRSRSFDRENDKAASSVRDHNRERTADYDRRDAGNPDAQDEGENGDHSRSGSREGDGSQTQSRSRSRGQRRSQRHRRHRSQSVGDDDHDDGHRRKKHRSSRKRCDEEEEHHGSKEDKHAEKSRSASPEESRKSGHRSHRDKDKDYESRRGHRSHRDRDKEHSRRRDKDRERDKARKERHRDKDRERDYRHGSTSGRPSVDSRSTPADKGFDPPSGPRASHDRERDRHGSHGSNSKGSTPKDPHTLEREARNRERLLKEAQRMALANVAGSKRGREEGDDGGRKGRRTSRRGDTRDDGDGEDRMRRLEAEREAGRWG
ncbi:Uncharacterized protein TCAP_03004 [Tolypocladium capitatum]|uniref:Nipped-B-like protein B n=1 Tax=Tolypocladium capitatum TaxID=45235 RepID=A0A2K3QHN2_9HYPO|nr:Uncharacterized protein TCAP_03004 [Tolypocladium capitatum]